MEEALSYHSLDALARRAEQAGKPISALVLADQAAQMELTPEALTARMDARLTVMEQAAAAGLRSDRRSDSGWSGGDACRMWGFAQSGRGLGDFFDRTLARALAVAEQNARMGRICAAPTAGSCGILPAVLITAQEQHGLPRARIVEALFTASAIGLVIADRANVSGAEGGCQAECGSAAAMAAGALAELLGGSPAMAADACAIALKSMLGLVCDPVGGLVETPCVKRNAVGAVHALAAAEMALAGIRSNIPADQVIDAMKQVGELMPRCLKETAQAGLAAAPAAQISKNIKRPEEGTQHV